MARVVALVPDLMFASRIEATLGAAGHEVAIVRSPDELGAEPAPDVVVADLGEVDPEAIAGQRPVLGFYSHVDLETRERAESAGVDLVVPRSRMAREMPALVDSLLSRSG